MSVQGIGDRHPEESNPQPYNNIASLGAAAKWKQPKDVHFRRFPFDLEEELALDDDEDRAFFDFSLDRDRDCSFRLDALASILLRSRLSFVLFLSFSFALSFSRCLAFNRSLSRSFSCSFSRCLAFSRSFSFCLPLTLALAARLLATVLSLDEDDEDDRVAAPFLTTFVFFVFRAFLDSDGEVELLELEVDRAFFLATLLSFF